MRLRSPVVRREVRGDAVRPKRDWNKRVGLVVAVVDTECGVVDSDMPSQPPCSCLSHCAFAEKQGPLPCANLR